MFVNNVTLLIYFSISLFLIVYYSKAKKRLVFLYIYSTYLFA